MPSLDQQTVILSTVIPTVDTDGSLVTSQEGVALENDEDSPGADKVYGTDSSGVRGWQYDLRPTHLEVTVDAETLQTIQSTPYEFISTPGANKYVLIERLICKQISQNTDYTSGGSFSIAYSGASGDNIATIGSIKQGANYPNSYLQMLSTTTAGYTNQIVNLGVSLKNSSSLSADGDSYLILIIDYTIQDLI